MKAFAPETFDNYCQTCLHRHFAVIAVVAVRKTVAAPAAERTTAVAERATPQYQAVALAYSVLHVVHDPFFGSLVAVIAVAEPDIQLAHAGRVCLLNLLGLRRPRLALKIKSKIYYKRGLVCT